MVIRNGHVVDPLNRIDGIADVVVRDGRIVQVGGQAAPESNTVDAAGCFVTPGFVDHHAHLYPLAQIGLPAEAVCFASGVTTVADAGSSGCATYEAYRAALQMSKLRIRAYLNVCATGLASLPVPEDVSPSSIRAHREAIGRCFARFGGELLGLKLRTSRAIVREQGYEPLRETVKCAEALGVSVMVHCTDPPGPMEELLALLRPGDVVTHMYMNKGPALTGGGSVIAAAREARSRGVLFEAADAREHFGMDVAQTAIGEGFFPDFIATDLTKLSMHLRPTAFNMAMQISKYTALGIPFAEVIRRCTLNPAKHMGLLDRAGSLSVGHPADIAVLRPVERETVFGDRPDGVSPQRLFRGRLVYQPVLTVKDGEMVYRDVTF